MLKSRFSEAFGLRYPLLGAPMAGRADGQLAAALTRAGGMGAIGGATLAGPRPDWVREQIRRVRHDADGPFAVGFITEFIPSHAANFEVCIEEKVPVLIFSFGDPRPYMARARSAGIETICQVQTVEGARWAVEGGADVIVAQGNEAGGHSGYLNTLPCLALVLEVAGQIPVLASGGIASGRSLAAVLAAGAEGAMLGTALLATPEATQVVEEFKQLIVSSDGEDTIHTRIFDIINGAPWPPGIGERLRRDNRLVDEWSGRENDLPEMADKLRPILQEATARADASIAPVLYGQAAGFIHAVRPVAEIADSICEEAEAVLRQRFADLLSP